MSETVLARLLPATCPGNSESLLDDFKHALIWGSSVKQSPQASPGPSSVDRFRSSEPARTEFQKPQQLEACGKDHIVHDEDVLQIVKLTQARPVSARVRLFAALHMRPVDSIFRAMDEPLLVSYDCDTV